MAKKKKSGKEYYPVVKYRIVDGNGYTVCDEDGLQEALRSKKEFCEKLGNSAEAKRFEVKYVIKVTEEYIEV